MIKDINGLGSRPSTETRPGKNGNADVGKSANTSTAAAAPSAAKQDEVELSSQVKNLKALEDKIQSLPEVNMERVEAIKAALEDNSFNIDDLVLADKILNTEGLLGE